MQLVQYRGKWCAYWRDGDQSRRVSLRTDDRAIAEQRLADLKLATVREAGTIAEVAETYLADQAGRIRDIERQAWAWQRLAPIFAPLRPDQVTRAKCREHAAARVADGVSAGTIARELSTLGAMLRWAGHSPVIEKPSAGKIDPRYLTRPQFARLWATEMPPHLRVFIAAAMTTAARSQAVLDLTWVQVDLDRRLIDLGIGHGNKRRATTPITDAALPVLTAAKAVARSCHVVEYRGRRVGSIKTAWRAALKSAGLPAAGPRILRHSAAVWMAEAGTPMSEIAQYLGHTSTAVTERHYARYSPGYLRRAAGALEW